MVLLSSNVCGKISHLVRHHHGIPSNQQLNALLPSNLASHVQDGESLVVLSSNVSIVVEKEFHQLA